MPFWPPEFGAHSASEPAPFAFYYNLLLIGVGSLLQRRSGFPFDVRGRGQPSTNPVGSWEWAKDVRAGRSIGWLPLGDGTACARLLGRAAVVGTRCRADCSCCRSPDRRQVLARRGHHDRGNTGNRVARQTYRTKERARDRCVRRHEEVLKLRCHICECHCFL